MANSNRPLDPRSHPPTECVLLTRQHGNNISEYECPTCGAIWVWEGHGDKPILRSYQRPRWPVCGGTNARSSEGITLSNGRSRSWVYQRL